MGRATIKPSVGDLYEAISDDSAWAALPATAARLVGARSSVIHELDSAGMHIGVRWSYLTDDFMADLARRHPDGRDIWVETGLGSGIVDRPVIIDDYLPEAAFLRSPLWNDVLRPHGDDTGHSIGMAHRMDGGTLAITFQRALAAGAFENVHAARFSSIATDLHRIFHVRRVLGARAARAERLEALLVGERARAMLVGPELTLIEASPDARDLLDRSDGIALRDGRLLPLDPSLSIALRAAVEATIGYKPVDRAVFQCPRPNAAQPWRLLVLPLPIDAGMGCLLLIRGGEPAADRMRLWLAQQYGATGAEIAVAEALLAGAMPEEISNLRRVSLNTIRTQIRRLLEKTGVRGITQLLIMLARLD